MAKKRPTLDAFLNLQAEAEVNEKPAPVSTRLVSKKSKQPTSVRKIVKEVVLEELPTPRPKADKHEIVRHMLYIPLPVYDQLQGLIFEEQRGQARRRKTHDYLLDAIDLLFKKKGLKSITELVKKEE